MIRFIFAIGLLSWWPAVLCAQTDERKVAVTGSIQSDWLVPEDDDDIRARKSDLRADFVGNTYIGVNLESKYLTAGLRFETMETPLPGFDNEFDDEPFHGTGLPFFQVTARCRWAELTAGTFYEQFGNGFILRAYEDRNLGIDNSILGGRLVLRPCEGLQVKALGGVERYHFSWTDSYLLGADVELSLDRWIKGLGDNGHYLTIGVSGVSKHEDDTHMAVQTESRRYEEATDGAAGGYWLDVTHYTLKVPANVGAMDFRVQYQKGGYNILAEYAVKAGDPSLDNGYIYRKGQAAMLSASYSRSGFSTLLQAKRSENMGFRIERALNPATNAGYINHQPAFAYQHTYALAALYPYGTQMDGEWAFQGEVSYKFKRNTALGGKYGTLLKLNASHIRGLGKDMKPYSLLGTATGTDGYSADFFDMSGDGYYQDINLSMEKRLSRRWKLNAMYMNQRYNQEIIEGHAVNGSIVKSHIGVLEANWQTSRWLTLRGEVQYLWTEQDLGDWSYALVEASIQPGWMLTLSDMWNNGETDIHYVNGSIVYNIASHRIQVGYGRTREGLNCNGGVCRKVPASRGFTLSYNYNF